MRILKNQLVKELVLCYDKQSKTQLKEGNHGMNIIERLSDKFKLFVLNTKIEAYQEARDTVQQADDFPHASLVRDLALTHIRECNQEIRAINKKYKNPDKDAQFKA
jgi:hypothetical protein